MLLVIWPLQTPASCFNDSQKFTFWGPSILHGEIVKNRLVKLYLKAMVVVILSR